MSLADLQAALQQDILSGGQATLDQLSVPKGASAAGRLHVYQHAYSARLIEILGEDYDSTWTYVGDQVFNDLANAYIRERPSNTPNARWYGDRFPGFLADQPIARDCPAVPELAHCERAIALAFDAANEPLATLETLAGLPAEQITQARFALHPSATLLRLETNAYDIFAALRADSSVPRWTKPDIPAHALFWRKGLTCWHKALSAEEGMLLERAEQGQDFSHLCEMAATMDDPDGAVMRIAGYLRDWVDQGVLGQIYGE